MIKLKLLLEADFYKAEVDAAKKVFKILSKEYNMDFPLEFKDLKGRSGGYLTTSKLRGGKHIFINKMTVDNSGMWGVDPDYVVCHEFAHAILATTKGSLAHSKAHSDLTYKLAKKFRLV